MKILQFIKILLQETYRATHGRHDMSLFFLIKQEISLQSVCVCLSEVGPAVVQNASLVNLHSCVVKMLTSFRHKSVYICTSYYPSCVEPLRQKWELEFASWSNDAFESSSFRLDIFLSSNVL
jgi:hypothetical protein